MRASIEWISGVVRVHMDDNAGYGSPYIWACTIHVAPLGPNGEKHVELKGFERMPTFKECRTIARAFAAMGYDKIIWYRSKDSRTHGINLRRYRKTQSMNELALEFIDVSGVAETWVKYLEAINSAAQDSKIK